MKELNRCLELRRQIADLEEKIEDIECRIRFPKAQTLSDMPRCSSSAGNPIENYIVQKEKYQSKKLLLETELHMEWSNIEKAMLSNNIPLEEVRLMYLRFNCGYPWKKCTAIMHDSFGGKWNENRAFRVYRGIVKSLQNT
jgi:hypothetical protein